MRAVYRPEARRCTMLARPSTPQEVAAWIVFLAAGEASYVTEGCLFVDGGYTAPSAPRVVFDKWRGPWYTARPQAYRLTNTPRTMSGICSDVEKQMVCRTTRACVSARSEACVRSTLHVSHVGARHLWQR